MIVKMTKNKILNGIAAICCGVLVCGSLSACGGDDDNGQQREEVVDDNVLASAEVTYQVRLGKDQLQMSNVEVLYLDASGKEQIMQMTGNEWTMKRSLKATEIPAKFELRVWSTQKSDLELEHDAKYEVGCISKIIIVVKNKAGRVICDCDGLGFIKTDFTTMTGEQLSNPLASVISGWFDSLFSTDKKTLEVYSGKIVYNDMSQEYW
jgi:hypothetical protein